MIDPFVLGGVLMTDGTDQDHCAYQDRDLIVLLAYGRNACKNVDGISVESDKQKFDNHIPLVTVYLDQTL